MKKLIYCFAILALSACSEKMDGPSLSNDLIKVELNSTVSTPDLETLGTRAPVDGTVLPKDAKVSVFGLAKSSSSGSSTDIDWRSSTDVLFAQREDAPGIIEASVDENGALIFGEYYYPVESTRNYSFYACYPFTTSTKFSKVDETINSYSATFKLSDQQDVMWAEAVAPDLGGFKGYNARYFRKATGAKRPMLQFKHLLTRLNFKVVRGEAVSGETEDVSSVYVKDISIVNQETNFKVTLSKAYVTNGTTNGIKVEPVTDSKTKLNVTTTSEEYQADLGLEADGTKKDYGTVLLVPNTKYSIQVTLSRTKDETWTNDPSNDESAIILSLDGGLGEDVFESGKAYEAVLTVYGWQKIGFETPTVVDWVVSDDEVHGGEIDF